MKFLYFLVLLCLIAIIYTGNLKALKSYLLYQYDVISNPKPNEQNLTFYLAYHKEDKLPKLKNYIPIHAGRAVALEASKDGHIKNIDWFYQNMQGDDTGDNISKDSRSYNEMTMIYWLYKNLDFKKASNYVGIGHYRRFLIAPNYEQYDIIIPEPLDFGKETIYSQYSLAHYEKDLRFATQVIREMHPDYIEDMNEYLATNKFFAWNVMIMKKELFLEYCNWIFPILEKIHHNIDYSIYPDLYQKRVIAFLSERITGIFLHKKIKEGSKVKITLLLRKF